MSPARVTLVLCAIAIALVVSPQSALGGHGSWTHHEAHVVEVGTSNYQAYSDVAGNSPVDYGYARIKLTRSGTLMFNQSVQCGVINEGCSQSQLTTASHTWSQSGTTTVEHESCAADDPHTLSGEDIARWECSGTKVGSLVMQLHRHTTYAS